MVICVLCRQPTVDMFVETDEGRQRAWRGDTGLSPCTADTGLSSCTADTGLSPCTADTGLSPCTADTRLFPCTAAPRTVNNKGT